MKKMSKVFFVAEAGKNFIDVEWKGTAIPHPVEYYLENAKKLALAAKEAGADAVKFQTHVFDDEQHLRSEARYEWIQFNESITPYHEFWKPLRAYCDEIGIEFMTTPMSKLAAQKVEDLVKRWKVGSGNVTDHGLLKYLVSTGKPIILSTGMSTQKQITDALEILFPAWDRLTLLYCKSIYPCPLERVDFSMVGKMKERFKLPVGFSDHTVEVTTPAKALVAGATIVEKHFTLDKNAVGPDHNFALTSEELAFSIKLLREYEQVPEPIIVPDDDEIAYWKNFRKTYAKR
jgi:sialic acid synthase SpsE